MWQAPSKKMPPPLCFGSARQAEAGGVRRRIELLCEQARRHETHVADRAAVEQLLHLQEARQRAPVIADPERHLRGLGGVDHGAALRIIHRHRLFDIDRLAGFRAAQGIVEMRVGQCRDIDRVDIVGVDDRVRVVVPARHFVASREILRQRAVAPHHRDQLRIVGLVETGPALDLRDIAAADHAPPDGLHWWHPRRSTVARRRSPAGLAVPGPPFFDVGLMQVDRLPTSSCACAG